MTTQIFFTVSTNYLTATDKARLSTLPGRFPLNVAPHDTGWWIKVPEQKFITDKTSKMRQEGYSESFAKLMGHALAAGCSWVNIAEDWDSEENLLHKEYFDSREFNDLGQLCAYTVNKTRASRAAKILNAYECATGKLEKVTIDHVADLITDLIHFCRFNGWHYKAPINMGLIHYYEEINDEMGLSNLNCHSTKTIMVPRKFEAQGISGQFTMHQGIPGGAQRDSFQNATLQQHGDFDFSIAIYPFIPTNVDNADDILAFLAEMLSPLIAKGSDVEIQIGPTENL